MGGAGSGEVEKTGCVPFSHTSPLPVLCKGHFTAVGVLGPFGGSHGGWEAGGGGQGVGRWQQLDISYFTHHSCTNLQELQKLSVATAAGM